MALVNCDECGKQVSDHTKYCPECGNRLRTYRGWVFGSNSWILRGLVLCVVACFILFYFSWLGVGYLNERQRERPTNPHEQEFYSATRLNKPSLSDFRILSLKGVWKEYRGFVAIGEIKNEGSIAAGVEVEIIARDKNGVLIGSEQFWPNSIYNIPPGETRGIDYKITEDRNAITIEGKVIKVQIWDD